MSSILHVLAQVPAPPLAAVLADVATDLPTLAGSVAGAVSLIGYVPYVRGILAGRTRPSLVGWSIWTAVGTCLLISHYATGARASIWVPLSYAVGPLVTAILALRYGDRGWSRLDRFCLAGAAISLVLWRLTGQPLVSLSLNIAIDALGALPTLRKTWRDPGSEDRLAWGLFFVGNTLNLLAISPLSVAGALYPLYLFVLAASENALLWWPRRHAVDAAGG